MDKPVSVLVGFVLDRIDGEPIAKRVSLYRALAEVASTPADAREYTRIAADLVAIERRHRQLVLNFRQRSA